MALPIEDTKRQVIPRWRDHLTTATIGELDSINSSKQETQPFLHQETFIAERIRDWRKHKSPSFASDLVATAIVNGPNDDALDAAHFLLSRDSNATPSARTLARNLLSQVGIDSPLEVIQLPHVTRREHNRRRIGELRQRLRNYPRNALAWVDLGLEYVKAGETESASRAVAIATSLEPSNRHVLRSSARFYVHTGEPDRALRILRRADPISSDPWLLAAEIAIAQISDTPSKFAKIGSQLARSDNLPPKQISELASAVATLEVSAGGGRRARQLFELSLKAPTENSVAQAEWASRVLKAIYFERKLLNTPRSFEAMSGEYCQKGLWKDALAAAWNWLDDQPFSHKPAVQGSYVAGVGLEQYDESIRIALEGRISNPREWLLLNNLTFSYASKNDVKNAEKTFADLAKPGETEKQKYGVWLATNGLLTFRRGFPEQGRILYTKAIEVLQGEDLKRPRAIAAAFLAREEKLARTDFATVAILKAQELAKGVDAPDVRSLNERLVVPSGNPKSGK